MSTLQILPLGSDAFGLLDLPPQPARIGVVVLVGGPQYRVGSHRHFVQLARAVAEAGHCCLRFDHRGIGDRIGPLPDFKQLDADIDESVRALLVAQPQLQAIVLWGLCDAASAALLYVQRGAHPRVGGLALLNPWVRSPQGEARARVRHYYIERLLSREFWAKLLRGGVGLAALREWFKTRQAANAQPHRTLGASFQASMAEGYRTFSGPILVQLSGRDHTAREFEAAGEIFPGWRGWSERSGRSLRRYPVADHTFSARVDQKASIDDFVAWLNELKTTGRE